MRLRFAQHLLESTPKHTVDETPVCDGIRTLRHILKDDIGIGDCRVVCPEKLGPPSAK